MSKPTLKNSIVRVKTPKGMPTDATLTTITKLKVTMFEGIETINLSHKDVEYLYERFKATHKYLSENKSKACFQFSLNFKDNGVSELLKFYDNPMEASRLSQKRLFVVRPTKQTKAERQTGVYQLEQIFDIIDGNTAPNAHIVVLIDREFNGLIYCYDGQHQTLSFADTILNDKSFKLDDLKAIILKKESEGFNFEYSKVWEKLKEFSEYYTNETFNLENLIQYWPLLEDMINDSNKTKLTGKIHFTDAQGAITLMRKLNEHISSHSNTQLVKTELDGSELNFIMYDTEYEVDGKVGLLSNLIPHINFFNRTDVGISKFLPETFSYDLNSKEYTEMNYDQYNIFIYNMIVARIHCVLNDNDVITYHLIPSKKNSSSSVARGRGSGPWWLNEMWKTYGLVPSVRDRYLKLLKYLTINDPNGVKDYIQNVISLASHFTKEEFTNRLSLFDRKRKMWEQSFKDEMVSILKTQNVMDASLLNAKYKSKYDIVNYNKGCVADLRFSTPYQLINLSHVILDTLPSSQSVGDWANAVLDVMTNNFDKYFKSNSDRFVGSEKATSLCRYNTFNDIFVKQSFISEVNEYASASDTSLWSKTEASQYLIDILKHTDSYLYLCPHSGEVVDLSNYESHHLTFRSQNPQKEFKFWFPLSKKYNNYISNDSNKNLVDDGGNFIDACDIMIEHCNTAIKKYKKSNNQEKVLDYEDSIDTFNKWKRRANDILGRTTK